MDEAPSHLLERLASLEGQRRYISGGTKDEYWLADELVHDAFRFCEHFERLHRLDALSANQREALGRLHEALTSLGATIERYDRSNISDLVESDKCWDVMRERAKETLEAFGNTVPG